MSNKIYKNLTLEQFIGLKPEAKQLLSQVLIDSYEDFLDNLYNKLDQAICALQRNKNLNYPLNEEQLSAHIIDQLKAGGINADIKEIAGRCDLVVEDIGKGYLWIGEAKRDKSVSHVIEGYLQLTTRYAQFEQGQREGGLIIYNQIHSIADFIETFKAKLPDHPKTHHHQISTSPCPKRPDFAFFSESQLPNIGRNIVYKVRHMGVDLLYSPEDKSAITAKSHQQRRDEIEQQREAAKQIDK